jgi:hypothetical protein
VLVEFGWRVLALSALPPLAIAAAAAARLLAQRRKVRHPTESSDPAFGSFVRPRRSHDV